MTGKNRPPDRPPSLCFAQEVRLRLRQEVSTEIQIGYPKVEEALIHFVTRNCQEFCGWWLIDEALSRPLESTTTVNISLL